MSPYDFFIRLISHYINHTHNIPDLNLLVEPETPQDRKERLFRQAWDKVKVRPIGAESQRVVYRVYVERGKEMDELYDIDSSGPSLKWDACSTCI